MSKRAFALKYDYYLFDFDGTVAETGEGIAKRCPGIGCMGRQTVERVGRDGCTLLHGMRPPRK